MILFNQNLIQRNVAGTQIGSEKLSGGLITFTIQNGETDISVPVSHLKVPFTATLTSTSLNRDFGYSTDNGLNYYVTQADIITAEQITLMVELPITHLVGFGAAGDVLTIDEF